VLNNLTQNLLNLNLLFNLFLFIYLIYFYYYYLVYYLQSAHVNIDVIYFEINHRNRLIYILTYMEVKNNKMLFNLCYLIAHKNLLYTYRF